MKKIEIFLILVLVLFFIFFKNRAEEVLAINKCFDAGGRWNDQKDKCQ